MDALYLKVEQALDTIRPYLEADGGNVEIIEITSDKKLKIELKPILKSDERVNLALKIDREFLKALRGEMMRRNGFRS